MSPVWYLLSYVWKMSGRTLSGAANRGDKSRWGKQAAFPLTASLTQLKPFGFWAWEWENHPRFQSSWEHRPYDMRELELCGIFSLWFNILSNGTDIIIIYLQGNQTEAKIVSVSLVLLVNSRTFADVRYEVIIHAAITWNEPSKSKYFS